MAKLYVVVSVVLMMMAHHTSAASGLFSRSHEAVDNNIITEEADMVGVGGEKLHDILTHDKACNTENETVVYSDGSTSTEYHDRRAGIAVLLLSDEPHACYIRDTDGEPSSCVSRNSESEDKVQVGPVAAVGYQEGETINLEEMPYTLRPLCANRRAVILRPAPADAEESEPIISAFQARSCKTVRVRVKVNLCSKKCWGICCLFSIGFEWQTRTVC